MKTSFKKLISCLLILLMAALLTGALAEEAPADGGALVIELEANEHDVEIAYSVSATGSDAYEGVLTGDAPACISDMPAGNYIITLTLPGNAVLTGLNGYPTVQRGTAQWMAAVENAQESLYVVEVEMTGAVEGAFEQIGASVTVAISGPRDQGTVVMSDRFAVTNLLPDVYTLTLLLPAGVYEDSAPEGVMTYTENADGTVAATMEFAVLSGDVTVLPTVRRIVSGMVGGVVSGLEGEMLSGVKVTLLDASGKEAASAVTNTAGYWAVSDLLYGDYAVQFEDGKGCLIPDGYVTLNDGNRNATINASAAVPASVTVFAFEDNNNNGTNGKNESGLGGVEVALVSALDGQTVLASAVTDEDGYATLAAPEGEYRLRAVAPEDYAFGKKGTAIRFAHSIMEETTDRTQDSEVLTLTADAPLEVGLGMEPLAKVTGYYWHDLNGDGYWQDDEPGLEGMLVTLTGVRNGSEYETLTDENGAYTFSRIKNGTYDVTYYVPDGYVFTGKASGDIARRSRMTTEANREDTDRISLERGDVLDDRNIGLMTECVIEGVCFLDANYNGVFDEGEETLPGVELKLSRQSNNVLLQTVVSDENGAYRFDGLRGSTFGIRALLPTGATYTVAVDDPNGNQFPENNGKRERKIGNITVEDGGYARILLGAIQYGSITGVVYYDNNFSSAWESGEKIAQSLVVTLLDADGEKIASVKTNKNGAYTFANLAPGQYRISMTAARGYAFTAEGRGSILHNTSDGMGESGLIDLANGATLDHMDIGMIEPASVRGVAFADANDNGLYDRSEDGLRGTVVRLMTATGEIASTEVDKNGEFSFEALMPGEYYLRYELPENGVFSPRVEGGNAVVGEGSTGAGDWFELRAGDAYEAPVCGGLDLGVISGFAYADRNGNGAVDADEELLAGLSLTLTPTRGDLTEKTVVTGEDGAFVLDALRPDTYTLTVTCPEDCVLSRIPGVTLGLKHGLESQSVKLTVGMGAQWTEQKLGCVTPSTWSGVAYYDENDDGMRDEYEAPAAGETVILRDADTGDDLITAVTDAEGRFTVEGIAPGRYVLVFPLGEGLRPPKAGGSHFSEQDGEMVTAVMEIKESNDYDGTLLAIVRETSLGGHVWLEQGGATTPVSGAAITLLDAEGQVVAEAVSAEDGAYAFDGLMPGDYAIDVVLPDGHAPVKAGDELLAETGLVSILDRTSGTRGVSGAITVRMARHQLALDIGSVLPGRLGDRCWLDLNGNGLQDGDEGGLPGVVIELVRDGETVATAVSDQYGYYVFQNIYPTTYTLRVTYPGEVKPTTLRPDLKLIVSVLQEDGTSIPVTVESNAHNYNADLGFILLDEEHLPEGYGEGATQDWTYDD